jgi:protein SCO1/2
MTATKRRLVSIAGLATAVGLALVARAIRPKPPLPVYGVVPAFALVDERGAPFTAASLQGHPTVADFIFTHCQASCPRLTKRMGELQGRLAKDGSGVRLASFSVDPENDTPPVLLQYATNAGADLDRWTFVTGPVDDVSKTVVQGFKVSAAKIARGANDYDVTHGDWFVLVDGAGQIRGYYTSDDGSDIGALVRDAERLERGR